MLGNSLGVAEKDKFTAIKRDAFGKTLENSAGNAYNMFTGKPQIGGLGYAFLFRNYRPNLGKWQTQDPLGYVDGWNNLAYCNNAVIKNIDFLGAYTYDVPSNDNRAILHTGVIFADGTYVLLTASLSVTFSGGESFSASASLSGISYRVITPL